MGIENVTATTATMYLCKYAIKCNV